MGDISLDDLIKKDRQSNKKGKAQLPKNKKQHPNARRGSFDNNRGRGFRAGDKSRPIHKDRVKGQLGSRRDERNQKPGFRNRREEDQGPRRIKRAPKPSEEKAAEGGFEKGRTLKVMGLHPDFTNEDLYKLFATQGALEKCLIEQDNFGRSLTTAIVRYHNAQSAKSAIMDLNQHKVMNSILTVEPYKNKKVL